MYVRSAEGSRAAIAERQKKFICFVAPTFGLREGLRQRGLGLFLFRRELHWPLLHILNTHRAPIHAHEAVSMLRRLAHRVVHSEFAQRAPECKRKQAVPATSQKKGTPSGVPNGATRPITCSAASEL